MNGIQYKDYFVRPVEGLHKRYEAIRSVVVDEEPMKEVAQRFEVSYGTVRNWVSDFRRAQDVGQLPPFSPLPRADVPRPAMPRTRTLKSKSPMSGSYRWRRDVG